MTEEKRLRFGRADARLTVPMSVVWSEPTAVRDLDRPIVDEHPDLTAWTTALDLEARLGLHGRVATGALLGEPVIVVAERDGWSEVRLPWQPSALAPEGYPGWLPSSHLVDAPAGGSAAGDWSVDESADDDSADDAGPTGTIATTLVTRARHGGRDLHLSLGTVLPLLSIDRGVATLRHPDGGVIEVPAAVVAVAGDADVVPGEVLGGDVLSGVVLDTARLFLDLPYLWGGLSGYGVDCSGLIHLAHRVHGVVVPRDAHDQSTIAAGIGEEAVRPGDPVFFAKDGQVHHVAMATGSGVMLHSPRTGSRVREDAVDSSDYAADTRSTGTFFEAPKIGRRPSE
jgi:cell wall-associated NlpC family hydrolase